MIQTGSSEPTNDGGASQPKTFQSIRLSEYTASVVKICWNSDQNAALARNSGMNATTRLRSSPLSFGLTSITTK